MTLVVQFKNATRFGRVFLVGAVAGLNDCRQNYFDVTTEEAFDGKGAMELGFARLTACRRDSSENARAK